MKVFIIDGNSIMNRSYYGIRQGLTSSKGISTGALYGFLNIYLKYIRTIEPDAVAAAFDLREPTFRHKADENYKANRKAMDPELAQQMPYIKKILSAAGASVLEQKGYEADDLIGSVAACCEEAGHDCYILTGDRDILQLLSDKTTVCLAANKGDISYTPEVFREEYGFEPINLIDYKALMGDPSDNYKGVAGIGKESAAKLIREFGNIESLYSAYETADLKPAMIKKLAAGREDADHCKWLATIKRDVPLDFDFNDIFTRTEDRAELYSILKELDLVSIIEKFGLDSGSVPAASEEKKEVPVYDRQELSNENFTGRVFYLFEDNKLFILDDNKIYYTEDEARQADFLASEVEKISFGCKKHYHFAFEHKGSVNGLVFDCEIAAYLIDPLSTAYKLNELISDYTGFSAAEAEESLAALPQLYERLSEKLSDLGMEKLFNEIELPLVEVLAFMEHTGIGVDGSKIRDFGEELDKDISAYQEEIYGYAGRDFNILSPKQLGTVLFEEMGLPAGKKTKTGYSTNAEVLEKLESYHPIIGCIIKYRQLTKLKSTYVEGLLKEIKPDGRIHTTYMQTETRTGRISSVEPNLQNIPVRTELGSRMRKFFVAGEGKSFVDADYSQIELRVLANVSGDTAMQEAFLSGRDIHRQTAAQVMGLPEEFITSEMRSAAKAVNFGIIYGMGAFSLSKEIKVSVAEAKKYIANYLAHYPKVSEYMERNLEEARKTGIVRTLYDRIRPVPEINNKNKMVQAAGERIVKNTPIQGTAADIIKMAMIRVYKRLKEEIPQAELVLQVHDELIVETPYEYIEEVKKLLSEEMENVARLAVPFEAEAACGKSWYEAKS